MRRKKLVAAGLALLLAFVLAGCAAQQGGLTREGYRLLGGLSGQAVGNTPGNLANGGLAAPIDDNSYYIWNRNYAGPDVSSILQVHGVNSVEWYFAGAVADNISDGGDGWVYFLLGDGSACRAEVGGYGFESLINDLSCHQLALVGDTLFVSGQDRDSGVILATDKNGGNRRIIFRTDGHYTPGMLLVGEALLYAVWNEDTEEAELRRVAFGGTSHEVVLRGSFSSFQSEGGTVYYSAEIREDGLFSLYELADGAKEPVPVAENVQSYYAGDGGLYYLVRKPVETADLTLYYRENGGQAQKLADWQRDDLTGLDGGVELFMADGRLLCVTRQGYLLFYYEIASGNMMEGVARSSLTRSFFK
ncbi:DUF5050 domain-containing protein [Christensenellaceae bacterium OttesenSCG-928-K19]|nr:DUF5050 domain-containing protein [Christensenellaceae bacterium OttesenSCG-928-K19]